MSVAAAMITLLTSFGCADDGMSETTPIDQECGQDVPLVSWETFGEGFVTTYCQGCHASTALDREGAPPNITFDSEPETLAWKAQILSVAATDMPTMPPNGGPSEVDRERLTVWLTCFAE